LTVWALKHVASSWYAQEQGLDVSTVVIHIPLEDVQQVVYTFLLM